MAVDHIGSLKAMLWEQTKGNLRALAALSGSSHERAPDYKLVQNAVNKFIVYFEREGFHE